MIKQPVVLVCSILFCSFFMKVADAQPTWVFDPFGKEKKPEQYENKQLASEKTADKKYTFTRKIIQNTVSHYNYYFNANNKLNAVIERAKMSNKDDYGKLLSFYPYSLENTASQKIELDSVIYKSTAGILLHDLRTNWVDNFYLLIAKAYFLRQDFDSAALTLQFINYNLAPRSKKEGDDDKLVGSNESHQNGALSIANKEKRNFLQKTFTLPPSRNDALLLLARTFIEQNEYGDAAGLLNILQNDPNLPRRLQNNLEEVNAYWFFSQKNYDSAANHLEKALSAADTKQDKSRWEYLLAQLYEINGDFDKASLYYTKAGSHTTDPVMDIYAHLNNAKMWRDLGDFKQLDNSINNLLKMARRDKYENYRDIIYYSAAQLTLQKPDTLNSIAHLLKSTKYNNGNIPYKNKAFLDLGNIAFEQKRYRDAHRYYDSLQLEDPELEAKAMQLEERKQVLGKLSGYYEDLEREDSLQNVAMLSAGERDALIKRVIKKYRKEQGLKESDDFIGNSLITFNNTKDKPVDLFSSSAKGDWYFNNNSMKAKGFSAFKSKWGKRENVDNWRRKAAMESALQQIKSAQNNNNPDEPMAPEDSMAVAGGRHILTANDYNYETMMANLPLTAEKLDSSNAIAASSMLHIAKIFQNDLQEYGEAIATYLKYIDRFSPSENDAEVYMGLYYCYTKLGNVNQAAYYKNIITHKYADTHYGKMILDPASLDSTKNNEVVTQRYKAILDLYVEGKYAEAEMAKQKNDSLYGNNYWTPQLLYIEAVHYIKENNDSLAIATLQSLQTLFPASPLKEKATTMIEVLGRRKQIVDYLNNLEITRAEEDKVMIADESNRVNVKPAQVEIVPNKPISAPVAPRVNMADSLIKVPEVYKKDGFVLNPKSAHLVIMILDKVDGVYVNEAKNAFARFNRESMATVNILVNKEVLDESRQMLVFSTFENANAAIQYYNKIKRAAPTEVSWLPAAKYSFLIITQPNLDLLKENKDVQAYRQLLNNNYENKF